MLGNNIEKSKLPSLSCWLSWPLALGRHVLCRQLCTLPRHSLGVLSVLSLYCMTSAFIFSLEITFTVTVNVCHQLQAVLIDLHSSILQYPLCNTSHLMGIKLFVKLLDSLLNYIFAITTPNFTNYLAQILYFVRMASLNDVEWNQRSQNLQGWPLPFRYQTAIYQSKVLEIYTSFEELKKKKKQEKRILLWEQVSHQWKYLFQIGKCNRIQNIRTQCSFISLPPYP